MTTGQVHNKKCRCPEHINTLVLYNKRVLLSIFEGVYQEHLHKPGTTISTCIEMKRSFTELCIPPPSPAVFRKLNHPNPQAINQPIGNVGIIKTHKITSFIDPKFYLLTINISFATGNIVYNTMVSKVKQYGSLEHNIENKWKPKYVTFEKKSNL